MKHNGHDIYGPHRLLLNLTDKIYIYYTLAFTIYLKT